MKLNLSFWFYFGTLLSSIGSFTFNICLVAFMIQGGYDLLHVSLILGLQRLVPLLVTGLLGHFADAIPPRIAVVYSELGAAIATLGILWAWSGGKGGYIFLLAFTILKASIVAFQAGSRVKITKILSDATYASNSSNAIWFNKATQGATLFAGLCAWPIIQYSSFETAIWFDLITFALNGLIIFFLPLRESVRSALYSGTSILSKFRDFYKFNPRAAKLDLLLAVSMMGTTSFTARLAGDDQQWIAFLIGGYGLAVWLAGYMEKYRILNNRSLPLWIGLAVSYSVLGFFPGQGILTLCLALCKDVFYWLLLHRISSHIQADTPEEIIGSVSSARITQMIFILATGELLVGSYSKILPVEFDGLWRGVFCVMIAGLVALKKFGAEGKQGYARL